MSAVRAADRVPALIEKRQQTGSATCHSISRGENFVRDGVLTLGLKKLAMARLAQDGCFSAHFEWTVLFTVLFTPLTADMMSVLELFKT